MADDDQNTEETGGMTDFEQWMSTNGATGSLVESTFGPDFRYSRRVVRGVSNSLTAEQQREIARSYQRIGIPGVADDRRYYDGEFLVDSNSIISRAPYDARTEVYDVLYGLSPTLRKAYSNILASQGFYGESNPSAAGTLSKDRTAWAEMLNAANAEGLTWDAFMQKLANTPPARAVGGGSKYRVTPREDIAAYLRQASLERLGRTMTKQDVDAAIAAIQQRQAGGDAPSLGVAAEQQVLKREPERERAFRFARAIDLAMSELGG